MTEPHPLDDLLEETLPLAVSLVGAVRDRDPEAVAAVLGPLLDQRDMARLSALVVDLAVMVDDERTVGELVAWTHSPHVPDDVYAEIVEFNVPRPGTKWCGPCGEWLPLGEFHQDRTRKDGRKPVCKSCVATARVERLAKAASPQGVDEQTAPGQADKEAA